MANIPVGGIEELLLFWCLSSSSFWQVGKPFFSLVGKPFYW
jgi:hypothetical protein